MYTKVTKRGEDFVVRIPREMGEELGLDDGDEVELRVVRRHLRLYTSVAPRIKLEDLLADVPPDFEPEVIDWGPPVGNEIW